MGKLFIHPPMRRNTVLTITYIYIHIHIHIQSHIHVLGEPESTSTVRDEKK